METPVMSPGRRSLVNCTRAKARSSERASAWARVVLPTPGTSSSSRCPPAASAASASSTISCLPFSAREMFVSRAFWAVKSPIALRVLSRADSALDEELLSTRVRRAWERRRALFPRADAFRLVHGEADLLPGYFADYYDGVVAVQHLSEWAEARREQLARLLVELTGARAVVARDDGSARDFEQLPRRAEAPLGRLIFAPGPQ